MFWTVLISIQKADIYKGKIGSVSNLTEFERMSVDVERNDFLVKLTTGLKW